MPAGVQLVPRRRIRFVPRHLRLAHEYCYFLHNECVRALIEYETADAQFVSLKFNNDLEKKAFTELADKLGPIEAMRASGLLGHARRVILNTITMAMTSDCLHHIYESLRCMEKRKFIVALNLLRKPLTDSLMYLSWMLGNEDAFYHAFTRKDESALLSREMGNHRLEILEHALASTKIADVLNAEFLHRTIFDRRNNFGLYRPLQHAVHLFTSKYDELKTEPENFNFIFKDPLDDENYETIYDVLPHLMLYISHVIMELFERMEPMNPGSMRAFEVRSILGLYLVEGEGNEDFALHKLNLFSIFCCEYCHNPFSITTHNAARLVLSETYRCVKCRRVQDFPFSWIF